MKFSRINLVKLVAYEFNNSETVRHFRLTFSYLNKAESQISFFLAIIALLLAFSSDIFPHKVYFLFLIIPKLSLATFSSLEHKVNYGNFETFLALALLQFCKTALFLLTNMFSLQITFFFYSFRNNYSEAYNSSNYRLFFDFYLFFNQFILVLNSPRLLFSLLVLPLLLSAVFAANNEDLLNKQINTFVKTTVFYKETTAFERYDSCVICINTFENGQKVSSLPCSVAHVFHTICLEMWFSSSISCPLCRTEFNHYLVEENTENLGDLELQLIS